jgi:hypothetical protein
MQDTDDKLSAVLTGMAVSAAAHVVRMSNDTQDRIDRQRDDLDGVSQQLRDLRTNGHLIRDMLPVVADLLSGVALARTEETTPSLLPSLQTINRPDLVSALTAAVDDFQWPPKPGDYTNNGYIKRAGELVSLGLILTYEEVRAFLHGLVLAGQPTKEAKTQAYLSASGLINAIIGKAWTAAQWRATWERLFGATPHTNAPTVTLLTTAVQMQVMPGARDTALVARFTVGVGGINAGTAVARVTFGTPWTNTPAVVAGTPWQSDAVTNAEYTLTTRQAYNPGDIVVVPVVVGSCDG